MRHLKNPARKNPALNGGTEWVHQVRGLVAPAGREDVVVVEPGEALCTAVHTAASHGRAPSPLPPVYQGSLPLRISPPPCILCLVPRVSRSSPGAPAFLPPPPPAAPPLSLPFLPFLPFLHFWPFFPRPFGEAGA